MNLFGKWGLAAAALVSAAALSAASDETLSFHTGDSPQQSIYHENAGLFRGFAGSGKGYFTPFQLTLWPAPYCHLFYSGDTVYGINLAPVMSVQPDVCGLNIVPLHVVCYQLYGVSFMLFGQVYDNHALMFAVSSYTTLNNGVQIGLFNNSSDTVIYFEKGGKKREKKVEDKTTFGLQIGFFNISATRGIQFGVINYHEKAAIPCFPIFNFAW